MMNVSCHGIGLYCDIKSETKREEDEKMKRFFYLSLLIVAMLCLAACQPTPESAVVASKNDGAFEVALENKAEETESVSTAEETAQHYTSSITSADGNVTYNVDVELPIPQTALPVLQVTPHSFTVDEAKQIATALFGDAEIYEYSNERSKSEIEAEILSLRQHISDRDALVEYYSGDEALADMVTEEYNNRIAILEAQYEGAAETVEPEA